MDAASILELLNQGGLTVYPLIVASIVSLGILIERLWRFRGLEAGTRELARETIDALVRRDVEAVKRLCEGAMTPLGAIFLEAIRWKDIALEDLERIVATSRQEATSELKRGLWIIGTVGALAPFVGLFGTVVGILRSFRAMALHGAGGFEVVAAGIAEALVATAAGLGVAIVALLFFNYLQVRVGALSNSYARACERFLQALLFVATADVDREDESEVPDGRLLPA